MANFSRPLILFFWLLYKYTLSEENAVHQNDRSPRPAPATQDGKFSRKEAGV